MQAKPRKAKEMAEEAILDLGLNTSYMELGCEALLYFQHLVY